MFEGSHGSGKTTQAKLLKDYLCKQRIPTIYTHEPYSEEIGKLIDRYSIVDNVSPYLLLYLYAADRLLHVRYIKEKLDNSNVVITDRYLLSSCVDHQIQGIQLELIEQINFFCIEPDVTLIFDVSFFERSRRLKEAKRLRNTLFFKEKNMKLEEKLYRNLFKKYKCEWKNLFMIDGERDINEMHKEIIALIERLGCFRTNYSDLLHK